jgi:hypothetical protein
MGSMRERPTRWNWAMPGIALFSRISGTVLAVMASALQFLLEQTTREFGTYRFQ